MTRPITNTSCILSAVISFLSCIAAARSGDINPGVTIAVVSPAANILERKAGPYNDAPAPPFFREESKSMALYCVTYFVKTTKIPGFTSPLMKYESRKEVKEEKKVKKVEIVENSKALVS